MEAKNGRGEVAIAHAPETDLEAEGDLTAFTGDGPGVRAPDMTLEEVVAALESKRDSLKRTIEIEVGRKDTAQKRVTNARAELVEVERLLKAAKPRGRK